MKEHIMPANDPMIEQFKNLQAWRTEYLYTYKVNYFYERNETIMRRMH